MIARLLAAATVAAALLAPRPAPAAEPAPVVAEGRRLYAEACAVCHGEDGRAGAGFQTPIWGERAQIAKFGHALGLFEYNQLMMPFDDPTRLTDEQKWAITAYMLAEHGAVPPGETPDPAKAEAIPIR